MLSGKGLFVNYIMDKALSFLHKKGEMNASVGPQFTETGV